MITRHWFPVCALAVALMAPALCGATTVTFNGSGQTTLTGQTGGVDGLELKVDDAPYRFTFPGGVVETDWLQDSRFIVDGLAVGNPGAARGHATYFNGLGDRIELDFLGVPVGGGPGFVVMHLDYDIVGGGGRFASADGTGFEEVTISLASGPPSFGFSGQGQLEIPEPGGPLLLLAGLAALVVRGRGPRDRPALLPA